MKVEYTDNLIRQLKIEKQQIKNKINKLETLLYDNSYDKHDYNTYKFLNYLGDSLNALKQYYDSMEQLSVLKEDLDTQEYLKTLDINKLMRRNKE